jgi:murein peptide amidase A
MNLPFANAPATMRGVTHLTPEQFAIVSGEVELMIAEGELDEAGRIVRMFEGNRFNHRATDFPKLTWESVSDRRSERAYPSLLRQIESLRGAVFDITTIGSVADHELVKIETPRTGLAICLVAGLHGDEADGIFAALEFAQRFLLSRELINTYALTIYPCVNPTGYERMTRENAAGIDLNREFFCDSATPEVCILERELRAREFTGFISGHSDYESFGIYAYATGAVLSERLAKPALFQASSVIPINTEPVIDGHPATLGIINQKFPGSLGPLSRGESEPFEITIETPNLFSLRKRVEAQAIAFETILHEYRAVASEAMYL